MTPKRALIMAGGGLKVAFQAGVLQVWLDEARDHAGGELKFDIADGASGGVFNLAMWAQGMTGAEIADNWRAFAPLTGLSVNAIHWLPVPQSLLTYDRFRRNVLRKAWRLDWDRIRNSNRRASFNLFNFTTQELRVLAPEEMDEDRLISAVSLPVWFPPVRLSDGEYIDAVFATDANLLAALAAGADELWIIWTVSQRGTWRNGPVNQYFQMIEAMANSDLQAGLDRIERSNRERAACGAGEFDRDIAVRVLSAEVPAHYLFNVTNAVMRESVERGVAAARSWCHAEGFEVVPKPTRSLRSRGVSFAESMAGTFAFGSSDPVSGAADGAREGLTLALDLRITIEDLRRFLTDESHVGTVTGVVDSDALGGQMEITDGTVELLTDDGDFTRKKMRYRVAFRTSHGDDVTIFGVKYVVHDRRLDLWADTTTLHAFLYRGSHTHQPREDAALFGTGIVRIGVLGFVRELASFRTTPGLGSRIATFAGFGLFFGRQLWEVYGRPRTAEMLRPKPATAERLP